MRNAKRTLALVPVAVLVAVTVATSPAAGVSPLEPGQQSGGPPFTSGNVGNGGGGALVVHIGNEACVTHFKDFLPTNQAGGCD